MRMLWTSTAIGAVILVAAPAAVAVTSSYGDTERSPSAITHLRQPTHEQTRRITIRLAAGSERALRHDGVRWSPDKFYRGGRRRSTKLAKRGRLKSTARVGRVSYVVPVPSTGRFTITALLESTPKHGATIRAERSGVAVARSYSASRPPERRRTVTYHFHETAGASHKVAFHLVGHLYRVVLLGLKISGVRVVTTTAPPATSAPSPTVASSPTGSRSPTPNPAGSSTPVPTQTPTTAPIPTPTTSPTASGSPTTWLSGVYPGATMSKVGANDFATYRAASVPIVTSYQQANNWNDIATNTWGMDLYNGWPGTLAISLQLVPNDAAGDLEAVAAGSRDSYFKDWASNLVARGRGHSIVRLGWEFNTPGNAWSAYDASMWVQAFRRAVIDIRSVAPHVLIDWCGLYGPDITGPSAFKQLYPGNAYVDVIGVDAYDSPGYEVTNAATWRTYLNRAGGLDDWLNFAKSHGKQLSLPEWGLDSNGGGGDSPLFIEDMHSFFAANASEIAFECYFNEPSSYIDNALTGPDQNPKSSAVYKQLWSSLD
jgi:hypothetical protein